MKFNCPDVAVIEKTKEKWHRSFALLPHRVGPSDCRWLETIERRRIWEEGAYGSFEPGYNVWEYRAIKGASNEV